MLVTATAAGAVAAGSFDMGARFGFAVRIRTVLLVGGGLSFPFLVGAGADALPAAEPVVDASILRERAVADLSVDEVVKAYPNQVAAIVESLGLGELAAAELIRMAEPAGQAWMYLYGTVGERFGGAWLDWSDGKPKLMVGVVGGDKSGSERVSAAMDASAVPYATVATRYSYDELMAVRDTFDAQARAADEAAGRLADGVEPSSAVVNEEFNRVDVVVPEELLSDLNPTARHPAVHVTAGPRPAPETAIGGGWGTAAGCGLAFPVVNVSDSSRCCSGRVTAGMRRTNRCSRGPGGR